MILTRLICLSLLLTCGCARTAVVKFWQPAGADISDLDRIVVMDFTGDQGKSVATSLSGQLGQNDFYTVVEPSKVQNHFQMASFSSSKGTSPPSLDGFLGTARAQGIDGVVVGDVLEYHCADKQIRKSPFRPGHDAAPADRDHADGQRREPRDAVVREGRVTVAFRLVDVDSGEVRAEHQVSHEFQQLVDKGAQIPSQGEVLEQLTQRCLKDIVAYLSPHEATSEVQLAQTDPLSRSRREIREGMQLAQAGKWDAAEEKWNAVLARDPNNHAALFNLAVVADHRQEYSKAEELAMNALRLQYRDCYAAGLEQIRAHRSAAMKANDQRDSQVTRIFAEEW